MFGVIFITAVLLLMLAIVLNRAIEENEEQNCFNEDNHNDNSKEVE